MTTNNSFTNLMSSFAAEINAFNAEQEARNPQLADSGLELMSPEDRESRDFVQADVTALNEEPIMADTIFSNIDKIWTKTNDIKPSDHAFYPGVPWQRLVSVVPALKPLTEEQDRTISWLNTVEQVQLGRALALLGSTRYTLGDITNDGKMVIMKDGEPHVRVWAEKRMIADKYPRMHYGVQMHTAVQTVHGTVSDGWVHHPIATRCNNWELDITMGGITLSFWAQSNNRVERLRGAWGAEILNNTSNPAKITKQKRDGGTWKEWNPVRKALWKHHRVSYRGAADPLLARTTYGEMTLSKLVAYMPVPQRTKYHFLGQLLAGNLYGLDMQDATALTNMYVGSAAEMLGKNFWGTLPEFNRIHRIDHLLRGELGNAVAMPEAAKAGIVYGGPKSLDF